MTTTLVPQGHTPEFENSFKFCNICGNEYTWRYSVSGYSRETGKPETIRWYGCSNSSHDRWKEEEITVPIYNEFQEMGQ